MTRLKISTKQTAYFSCQCKHKVMEIVSRGRGKNKLPGFTLLEVMVALAILAITLMAVYDSQSASISRASEAKFTTKASLLAQKKMAEIEIMSGEDLISDSGDFGDDNPGYTWDLTVENPSIDVPDEVSNHLKQIDLTVSWGEDELYTYILRQYRFSLK